MVVVYNLTPANALQSLQDEGLDALGVTAPMLSPVWSGIDPTLDLAAMTMTFGMAPNAPFRGVLDFLPSAPAFREVTGAPITGAAAVLRLHPQAAARLSRIAASRYGANPQVRVVPAALVIRGVTDDASPRIYDAAEALPSGGGAGVPDFTNKAMSFHDSRGLIIDPVAVAAMLSDLLLAFPALDIAANPALATQAGGVTTIAGKATGQIVHVVSLHGRVFAPVPGGPSVARFDAGTTVLGAPDANGLATLGAGERIGGTGATAAARLRVGFAATGARMTAGPIAPPALAAGTLGRQFIRVFAVDLDWHLKGNRSGSAVGTVPADDTGAPLGMPASLHPQVRDGVTIDYFTDGPDTLAGLSQTLARIVGAPASLVFATSPQIVDDFALPAAPGAGAHWPQFPAPNSGQGFPAPPAAALPSPVTGATAQWSGTQDVLVTIPAGTAPVGASVRAYPQKFMLIEAIGEAPSFVRDDGATTLAAAGQPMQLLLRNPFGLLPGDPQPPGVRIVFDLVITPRVGARRLFAAVSLPVAAGPAAAPADPFAAPAAPVPPNVRAVAPVKLFGMTGAPPAPAGMPATPAQLALAFLSETQPRQGPRLPTMGRHETVVVSGIGDATQVVAPGLSWDGVLTGARWSRESLSAQHRDGNPGNPAGPDAHCPGVHVTGLLAHDLARHAVRRVQPILIFDPNPRGWLIFSGGDNFNPPQAAGGATVGTSSGVLLQTISAVCETPELSLIPDNNILLSDTPITFQQVLTGIGNALGLGGPPAITVGNEDRLINEIRREAHTAKKGIRDALWSLTRAFEEAEELVYIETAGLARTARAAAPPAHRVDLIQRLADRLGANPALKVVVCCPRETDFAPAYPPFIRRAIALRAEAVNILNAAGPGRVAVFHPKGFPGRAAALRATTVVVDDVWCLSGATHLRRRGMTFDGSAAVASFDRDIEEGYSLKVRAHRRALMAAKLGVAQVDANGLPTGEWVRLERPDSAFDLIADLLAQGGLGLLSPLWLGPEDDGVILQTEDVTDPDGSGGADFTTLLASVLSD